ncbi:MAG: hypothetical protein ACPG7F_00055 [Aggregatilineales bacterium]
MKKKRKPPQTDIEAWVELGNAMRELQNELFYPIEPILIPICKFIVKVLPTPKDPE